MIGLKWLLGYFLPLILLLDFSAAYLERERLNGDISEDEISIDRLKNLMDTRHALPPDMPQLQRSPQMPDLLSGLEIEGKIPFAVPPSDPRYYLPSSVLRGNKEGLFDLAPPEDIIRKDFQPHFVDPSKPHHSPLLLEELFSRVGQQGPQGLSREHDFGPGNFLPHLGGAESPHPDSVNFLQESRHQAQVPNYYVQQSDNNAVLSDFYFVALVSGCTAAAVCAVLGAGICYFRLHKSKRDAADAEYPAYGVTGPCKDFSPAAADRKLAQSAHMFHYQHQKQQMIALEKSSVDERHCSTSDVDSEEEDEEGAYTVYECPGLAHTGDLEVKNPLFSDDPTPATPARSKGIDPNKDDDDDDEED